MPLMVRNWIEPNPMDRINSSVHKAHRAPLHSAGHERAVGVFDEGVEQGPCARGVGGEALFPAKHGAGVAWSRLRVGRDES